jgi:hypothetical protein
MANWFIAALQFGIGIVHLLLIFRNAQFRTGEFNS